MADLHTLYTGKFIEGDGTPRRHARRVTDPAELAALDAEMCEQSRQRLQGHIDSAEADLLRSQRNVEKAREALARWEALCLIASA